MANLNLSFEYGDKTSTNRRSFRHQIWLPWNSVQITYFTFEVLGTVSKLEASLTLTEHKRFEAEMTPTSKLPPEIGTNGTKTKPCLSAAFIDKVETAMTSHICRKYTVYFLSERNSWTCSNNSFAFFSVVFSAFFVLHFFLSQA